MVAIVGGALAQMKNKPTNHDLDAVLQKRMEEEENKPVEAVSYHKNADNYDRGFVKKYIHLGNWCESVVTNDSFNLFIIFIIVLAGIIVGLQTYKEFEFHPVVADIDSMILIIFTLEVIMKIIAEGLAPWLFFVGPERGWNIFDLIIVILSLPIWGSTFGGNSVQLLRLTRLMRVMKLVKKIPQLQMIVMGLIGGLRSIVYILALLVLVFYLYAILGFYMFNKNDPFHFRSVPVSVITLFRMATLEDWTDVMYIQYFGCDSEMFDSNYEYSDAFGVCPSGQEATMQKTQGFTVIYFVSFIIVSALVIMSLFVGAVTMSMTESMSTMKMEAELAERKRRLLKAKRRAAKGAAQMNQRTTNQPNQTTDRPIVPLQELQVISVEDPSKRIAKKFSGTEMREIGKTSDDEGEEDFDQLEEIELNNNEKNADPSVARRKSTVAWNENPNNILAQSDKNNADDNKKKQKFSGRYSLSQPKNKEKAENILKMLKKPNSSSDKTAAVFPLDQVEGGGKSKKNLKIFALKTISSLRNKRGSMLWNAIINPGQDQIENEKVRAAFKGAWEGIDLLEMLGDDVEHVYNGRFKQKYAQLANKARKIVEANWFSNFIIFTILVASVLVGVQTEESMNKGEAKIILNSLDNLILAIFMTEIILKTIVEKFYPWRYFIKMGHIQGWNCFDYFVVIGSLVPGSGSMLTMLRLLRLLRVLKLVKSLPELQVIIIALIGGLSSISYIGVILFLVFYVFAILGMILFQESDPWHFGTLHISLFSLFRMATLEDWTDVMYVNMYGCDKYGYLGIESTCTKPKGFGAIAALYFIVFVLIGALVLMTLFIGVVTTSMEEATTSQREQKEFHEQLEQIKVKHKITDKTIKAYQIVFKMLDLDGSGTIEEEELKFGLGSIGKCPNDVELRRMLKVVDEDESGEIDFIEFVRFMRIVRNYQGGSIMYQADFKPRATIVQRSTRISERSEEKERSFNF